MPKTGQLASPEYPVQAAETSETSTGTTTLKDVAYSTSKDSVSTVYTSGPDTCLPKHRIYAALHRTTSSPEFQSAPQLQAFLMFIVHSVLNDREDQIKGYTIATQALGRDQSFNPVSDPIVRVEAARLRRRLNQYYCGSGQEEDLKIRIPKGGYAPVFDLKEPQIKATGSEPAPAGRQDRSQPDAFFPPSLSSRETFWTYCQGLSARKFPLPLTLLLALAAFGAGFILGLW